jgi:hypothetical protein
LEENILSKFKWSNENRAKDTIALVNSFRKFKDGAVTFGFFEYHQRAIFFNTYLDAPKISKSEFAFCVERALISYNGGLPLSADTFCEICDSFLSEYRKKPLKNFIVFATLSHGDRIPFKQLKIGKANIDFCPQNIVKYYSGQEKHRGSFEKSLQSWRMPCETAGKYKPCTVTCRSRSEREAHDEAMEALDIYRGLVNICVNSVKAGGFSFGAPPSEPINQLRTGRLFSIHNVDGTTYQYQFWYIRDFVESRQALDTKQNSLDIKKFIVSALARLKVSKLGPSAQDAIRRYGNSLDTNDWPAVLRELWSTLEYLTDTRAGNSHDVTVRRAAASFKDIEFARFLADHLRHRRNRLIHHSQVKDDEETLAFQLIKLVEPLILRVLWNKPECKSLEEFGQLLDLPRDAKSLARKKQLIGYAQSYHEARIRPKRKSNLLKHKKRQQHP